MAPRIKVGDLVHALSGVLVGTVLEVDGVMLRIRWPSGRTTTRPRGTVEKTAWHGCSDPRGHSFDEGICACGMDLKTKEMAA
jgi:hypothetical protein